MARVADMLVAALLAAVVVPAGSCLLGDEYEKVDAMPGGGGAGGSSAGGGGGTSVPCPSRFSGHAPADCDQALLFDGDDCCVMGRSCAGGNCINGRCEAVRIAGPPADPDDEAIGIAVVDDQVVWATGQTGKVMRVANAGGPVTELATDSTGWATDVLAFDGYAYWVEYQGPGLRRVDVYSPHSDELVSTVTDGLAGWGRLASRAGQIYFAMADSGDIWLADATGANPQAIRATGAAIPQGVAVDGTHLYFSEFVDSATSAAGRVMRLPLAAVGTATPAEELEGGESKPRDLVVDATHAYWANDDGEIRRIVKDASSPSEVVADNQEQPVALVVDDVFVYWGSQLGAEVRRARKSGGGPEAVATLPLGTLVYGMTQTCDALYFTTDAAEVWRVTK